jgi:hypothetical protein
VLTSSSPIDSENEDDTAVVEGEEAALYWASKDLALFSASVDEQPVGVEPF